MLDGIQTVGLDLRTPKILPEDSLGPDWRDAPSAVMLHLRKAFCHVTGRHYTAVSVGTPPAVSASLF